MAYKRNYLKDEEFSDLMLAWSFAEVAEKITDSWPGRGMLSKDAAKYLRAGRTFFLKAWDDIVKGLDEKELKKIIKRSGDFHVRLFDNYTASRFKEKEEKLTAHAHIPTKEFYTFCEHIMDVECKNCSKDRNGCKLYEVLENNLVSESGWSEPNCKYAYTKLKEAK